MYYYYKGSLSIVYMASSDLRYRFTIVDVGAYSWESDGGFLRESKLGSIITRHEANFSQLANLSWAEVRVPHMIV